MDLVRKILKTGLVNGLFQALLDQTYSLFQPKYNLWLPLNKLQNNYLRPPKG